MENRVIKVIKHVNVFPRVMPPSLLETVLALCESVCQSVCSSVWCRELVKTDGGVMLIPICCNQRAYRPNTSDK